MKEIEFNYKCHSEGFSPKNPKKAFTLAEVLITLAIIGVIASMTVPALQKNIERTRYSSLLKKSYSELSQAAFRIKIDEGGTLKGAFTGTNDTEKGKTARDKFAKYLKTNLLCESSHRNWGNCWANETERLHRYDNGHFISWWPGDSYGLKLIDGRFVIFYHFYNTDCSSGVVRGSVTPDANVCGSILLDINGQKGPNRFGYDVYDFLIYPDVVKPNGDGNTCIGIGEECSSYYLINN